MKQKGDVYQKYVGFGKIETHLDGEHFAGDIAFFGDDNNFSVEVFAFGTVILKAEEIDGVTTYYYMGNKYEESFITRSSIPIRFKKLKGLLIEASKGKKVEIDDGSYKMKTVISDEGKFIYIKDEERGEIKIMLEAEK